jgi:hypothetical protein
MVPPREPSGAVRVCARLGCENPLTRSPGGGALRRYCSDECRSADRRERRHRADAAAPRIVPLSVVGEEGDASPVAELRALSARLAGLAHAVESALVDAEVDAVGARIASVEAVAAGHLAERRAAEEHRAGLAAEEAAEVAEDRASEAATERDHAVAEASELAARVLEAEARSAADRSARIAAECQAEALTGERDRLVAQLAAQVERDAASVAALARSLRMAEDRAEALGVELAALRSRRQASSDQPAALS